MAKFTEIPYMYRSYSNYKSFGAYVAEGEITAEQRQRLEKTLGVYSGDPEFIPQQIGQDHIGSNDYSLEPDEDGPIHEMNLDEIKVHEVPDGDRPHISGIGYYVADVGDVEDFVSKMEKAKAEGWKPEDYAIEDDDWDEDEDWSYGDSAGSDDEPEPVIETPVAAPAPKFASVKASSPKPPSGGAGGFDPNRVPAGNPKGGQFAPKTTPEAADVKLDWDP